MFDKQKEFARRHIILTAVNHVAAGFGIALILQHSLAVDAFLPVAVGWALLAFSAAVHIVEWARK